MTAFPKADIGESFNPRNIRRIQLEELIRIVKGGVMRSCLYGLILVLPMVLAAQGQTQSSSISQALEELLARARSLELKTQYVPPAGDPLTHHTSGFAKIMCSAVFITGLDPAFAAENVGYFTSPYAERAKVGRPLIDRENRAVHVTLPSGVVESHVSLFDGSNCGLKFEGRNVFSVQHHPEASPGPHDAHYLFERFVSAIRGRRS